MARQKDQQQNDPVVAAIERVLKAERDGVQRLMDSKEEAQRLLSEARARAAAVGQSRDACIAKLHTAYLQKTQLDITALADADPLTDADADRYDRARLEAAAARAAAKLAGGA